MSHTSTALSNIELANARQHCKGVRRVTEQLLKLPQEPGTVIAIGEWWLVRLMPYEGAPSAWELLPFRNKAMHDRAARNGVKAQCVYDDGWVLAEAEQEGYYAVISTPLDHPFRFGYHPDAHYLRGKR